MSPKEIPLHPVVNRACPHKALSHDTVIRPRSRETRRSAKTSEYRYLVADKKKLKNISPECGGHKTLHLPPRFLKPVLPAPYIFMYVYLYVLHVYTLAFYDLWAEKLSFRPSNKFYTGTTNGDGRWRKSLRPPPGQVETLKFT